METVIPCVLMRGGTSRGPFFLGDWLPADPLQRDRLLLTAMGSPHALQVDGLGGGNTLTSKVAIVSRSTRPDCDIDYLFAQVSVDRRGGRGELDRAGRLQCGDQGPAEAGPCRRRLRRRASGDRSRSSRGSTPAAPTM